jgi:hypothetical protein
MQTALPSRRVAKLKEVQQKAIDNALGACTAETFRSAFPFLVTDEAQLLDQLHSELVEQVKKNVQVRFCVPACARDGGGGGGEQVLGFRVQRWFVPA